MVNSIFGSGTVTHTAAEYIPNIQIHNKVPFADYETALTEVKKRVLHPGELLVVYYYDPLADDGIASMQAVGPLQEGGLNDLYKSSAQIDATVEEIKRIIAAQTGDVSALVDAAMVEINEKIANDIDVLIKKIDTSVNEIVDDVSGNLHKTLEDVNKNVDDKLSANYKELTDYVNSEVGSLETTIQNAEKKHTDDLNNVYTQFSNEVENVSVYTTEKLAETTTEYERKFTELADVVSRGDVYLEDKIDKTAEDLSSYIAKNDASAAEAHTALEAHINSVYENCTSTAAALDKKVNDGFVKVDSTIKELADLQNASYGELVNYIDNVSVQTSEEIYKLQNKDISILEYVDIIDSSLRNHINVEYENLLETVENIKKVVGDDVSATTGELAKSLDEFKTETLARLDATDTSVKSAIDYVANSLVETYNDLNETHSADIQRIEDKLTEDVKNLNASVAATDASLADLKLETETQLSELNNKFNASVAAVDLRVDDLSELVQMTDASLSNRIDAIEMGSTEALNKAIKDLQAADVSVFSYIDDINASIHNHVTEEYKTLLATVEDLSNNIAENFGEFQGDTSVIIENINNRILNRIESLESSVYEEFTGINEHIDASYVELSVRIDNTVSESVDALDASIKEYIETQIFNSSEIFTEAIQNGLDNLTAEMSSKLEETADHLKLHIEDASAAYGVGLENVIGIVKNLDASVYEKFATVDSKFETVNTELTGLRSVDAVVAEDIKNLKDNVSVLNTSVISLEDKIREISGDVVDVTLGDVNKHFSVLDASVNRLEETTDKHEQSVDELVTENESLKETVTEMQATIVKLKTILGVDTEEEGLIQKFAKLQAEFNARLTLKDLGVVNTFGDNYDEIFKEQFNDGDMIMTDPETGEWIIVKNEKPGDTSSNEEQTLTIL